MIDGDPHKHVSTVQRVVKTTHSYCTVSEHVYYYLWAVNKLFINTKIINQDTLYALDREGSFKTIQFASEWIL